LIDWLGGRCLAETQTEQKKKKKKKKNHYFDGSAGIPRKAQ
jgi:hypothetical protein